MIDLFSTEFLAKLKTESQLKGKPSKAILNAIQELSQINQASKKKIQELQQYIIDLKQENSLLIQLLQAAKNDYSSSLETKQEKFKAIIARQANLIAENQSLKRKIANYEIELNAYKQITLKLKSHTQIGSREELRLSEITLSKRTNQGSLSEFDLEAYLSNDKKNLKTSRNKINESIQQQLEFLKDEGLKKYGFQLNEESTNLNNEPISVKRQKKELEYCSMDSNLLDHLLNEQN